MLRGGIPPLFTDRVELTIARRELEAGATELEAAKGCDRAPVARSSCTGRNLRPQEFDMSHTITTVGKSIRITATSDGRYCADDGDGCVAYGATKEEAAFAVFNAGVQRKIDQIERGDELVEKGQN